MLTLKIIIFNGFDELDAIAPYSPVTQINSDHHKLLHQARMDKSIELKYYLNERKKLNSARHSVFALRYF